MNTPLRKFLDLLVLPRISLQYLIPLLLLLFTLVVSVFSFTSDSKMHLGEVESETRKFLETELNHRQGVIEYLLANNDHERADHEIKDLTVDRNIKLSLLINDAGSILAASERGIEHDSLHQILSARFDSRTVTHLEMVLDETTSKSTGSVYLSGDKMNMFGINPVVLRSSGSYLESKQIGAILVHYDLTELKNKSRGETFGRVFFNSAFLVVISLFLWFFLYFFITRRINTILSVINAFGGGDHSIRSLEVGRDEVAVIGKGLNLMMDEVSTEIENRKLTEKNLRLFKTLIDQSQDAIFIVDADSSKLIEVNEKACTSLEYSQSELLAKHVKDIAISLPDIPSWRKHIDAVKQKGHLIFEDRLLKKNGSEISVEISTRYIEEGNSRYMIGIARDVSQRKEMEAFIRNILENVGEGFAVINRELRIDLANRAYSEMVGMPASEMVGKLCHKVTHNSDLPCFRNKEDCPVYETFEDGMAHTCVHTHHDKGRTTFLEISSYPMIGADGRMTAAIETINDITEKTNLQEQLAQSQKMEAVGLLAGGIAHDFNNNLTAILGYAELAKDQTSQINPVWEDLNQIIMSGRRAADLIRGLLAFSRKQIIMPKASDLNTLVEGTEALLKRMIGEDIQLTCHYADHPLMVKVDKSQIEQVILNLATNAREVMPDGGSLEITTGEITEGTGEGCIDLLGSPGNCAFISVKDSGPGMDPEIQSKIFEPFFTTKEFGTGSGLGLAIVYGIVQQHHGQIKLTSKPGHGTEFMICLPLTDEPIVAPAAPAQEQGKPARGSETILLAEDDEQVLAILKAVLQKAGYRIIEAKDGEEAFEQYQKHKESIELLLLDVVMPKKSGNAVYEMIKEQRPDIKAIFISGYARDMVEQKSMISEGSDFIAKPFDQAELLRKIRAILG